MILLKKTFILTGILLIPFLSFSQRITNIRHHADGNKIIVTYNVTGLKFFQYFTVSLHLSTDNGKTYSDPLKGVSGDVGEKKIVNGAGNTIVWDIFKDVSSLSGDIVFDVRTEKHQEKIKKNIFISYNGMLAAPAGLRFGSIGKTGWYAGALVSHSVLSSDGSISAPYECTDDGSIDFTGFGYYEFDDEVVRSMIIGTVGLTFQAGRNFFLYLGGGYGKYDLLWHINKYDYGNDIAIGDDYITNTDHTLSGPVVETGIMLRMNKLLISGGATVLNFERVDITFGLGLAF